MRVCAYTHACEFKYTSYTASSDVDWIAMVLVSCWNAELAFDIVVSMSLYVWYFKSTVVHTCGISKPCSYVCVSYVYIQSIQLSRRRFSLQAASFNSIFCWRLASNTHAFFSAQNQTKRNETHHISNKFYCSDCSSHYFIWSSSYTTRNLMFALLSLCSLLFSWILVVIGFDLISMCIHKSSF